MGAGQCDYRCHFPFNLPVPLGIQRFCCTSRQEKNPLRRSGSTGSCFNVGVDDFRSAFVILNTNSIGVLRQISLYLFSWLHRSVIYTVFRSRYFLLSVNDRIPTSGQQQAQCHQYNPYFQPHHKNLSPFSFPHVGIKKAVCALAYSELLWEKSIVLACHWFEPAFSFIKYPLFPRRNVVSSKGRYSGSWIQINFPLPSRYGQWDFESSFPIYSSGTAQDFHLSSLFRSDD